MATDIEHTFKPGETIHAVIRFYSPISLSADQIKELMIRFNELNGQVNPKPGKMYRIPIMENNNVG